MKLAPLFVLLTANALGTCTLAADLPAGGRVAAGTAGIATGANSLVITQGSDRAVINWSSFSVGAGNTVQFVQPSTSSAVLNRVVAANPSQIYGSIIANGNVWLVNPSGIMIGSSGRIDTTGFVASTLHVRDEDFLAGRHVFLDGGASGNIINQGEIRPPPGGSVYLVGTNVANYGTISAPQGEAILAAGATVSLSDTATPGVRVDITGSAGDSTNAGMIAAEAGSIVMAGVNVRNSGLLNAGSGVAAGGRVYLKASQDTYVDGNGRIMATGTAGGHVEVLGKRVAVMDYASIDTSGTNGGGQILVGGSSQGTDLAIQNANITYFGPNASLKSDATAIGNGGSLVVWANDATRVLGTLTAKGGATSGNGGYVETSGQGSVEINGLRVNTSAPAGAGGTWQIDPINININTGAGAITTGAGSITIGSGNIAIAGSSSGGSLSLARGSLAVPADARKLLQRTAGSIALRGAPSIQTSAPTPSPASTPPALRASAPAARLVNTGSLVDGAVTVRLSLVDAAPISLR